MADPPIDMATLNFAGLEFAAQCNLLSDAGVPDNQTIAVLRNIWLANEAREHEILLHCQAEQEQAQRDWEEVEEAKEQRRR